MYMEIFKKNIFFSKMCSIENIWNKCSLFDLLVKSLLFIYSQLTLPTGNISSRSYVHVHVYGKGKHNNYLMSDTTIWHKWSVQDLL